MYLFIRAAERENSFLTLAGKSKEFFKNKEAKQSKEWQDNKETKKNKELLSFLTPHRSAGHAFDNVIVFTQQLPFRRKKSPDVLRGIDELLKKFVIEPRTLKGICVLSGPGQFSFLRASIAVANTFGWALQIPVVGIESSEFDTAEEFLEKGLKKLNRKKHFQPIVPAYGKEPNITISKKAV